MKYNKVGLVLGGGGAKGAYQIGVFKALKENNLLQEIKLISGTSIGAINSILIVEDNLNKALKVWEELTKDKILTKKRITQYFDFSSLKNISVYSRTGFLNLLENNINLESISNCNIELYATATPLKNEFAQTVFPLNGQTPQMIKDILLASSAIPGIFEGVKIKGVYYMDGFRISNVPTKVAITKGCDLVYVVPLGRRDNPDASSYPNATIINFKHPSFDDISFNNGTLGFDPRLIQERIELGYKSAQALISHLRKIGVITVTRKEKFYDFINRLVYKKTYLKNRKKYYSLEDIGIYRISPSNSKKELSEEEVYDKAN